MSFRRKLAPSAAAYSSLLSSLGSAASRRMPNASSHRSFTTSSITDGPNNQLDAIFRKKRNLRTKVREALKNMNPIQRSQEKEHAVSRKKVYVPRVEDRFSNMKMLKISNLDDLIMSSVNILEPAPLNSDGDEREDVMQACEPVDLFILPGLAFDKSGRRLGRSGGYYDMFLKNYEELAKKKSWKQPFLVALAYSVQIMEKETMPVTPNDIPVDALVSPAGFIPISPVARNHIPKGACAEAR